MGFKEKENYNFYDLVKIMELLRGPNGCPWDKEQTHKSIRQNFIEETYEAVEAIDTDNTELLKEELGDVLLQVVFHARIKEEEDSFNIDDVCNDICKKLILRHPHIFSNVKASTQEKVLENWDNIKMESKSQESYSEVMESVSKWLPGLIRAQKIQHRAAKVGFDWKNVDGAIEKTTEELEELKFAIKNESKDKQEEELGDLLFSVVNISRFLNLNSEEALYKANEKFINRFAKVEALAKERNIDIKTASLKQMDSLWDEIKQNI